MWVTNNTISEEHMTFQKISNPGRYQSAKYNSNRLKQFKGAKPQLWLLKDLNCRGSRQNGGFTLSGVRWLYTQVQIKTTGY